MTTYRCPVCGKSLTKKEYEKSLGILKAREQHLHFEAAKFQKKLQESEQKRKAAKQEGVQLGLQRNRRVLQGKDRYIEKLKDAIRQLKRGTTPQTEGLEFEDKLAHRLKREFPQDDIVQTRKGGDVLQIVAYAGKPVGRIVFECKRTAHLSGQHVRQAARAKQSRVADFAVVVTTGTRKGFGGLAEVRGVLIVAPLGVVPLAQLLREHLIEMARRGVEQKKRRAIAQSLLKYITSPQFRNPIEGVARASAELRELLAEEVKGHYRVWQKRGEYYQRINWDASQIRSNIGLVLEGKQPKTVLQAKVQPLHLPEPERLALAAKADE